MATPSLTSILYYKLQLIAYVGMRKRRNKTRLIAQIQEDKPDKHNGLVNVSKEGNDSDNLTVDQEIECPRCHDIMTLFSDFGKLCYVCEECTFLISLN